MKVIKFTAGDFSEVYTIFYCVVDLFDLFESELYAMWAVSLLGPPPPPRTLIETSKINLSLRQEEDDKEE